MKKFFTFLAIISLWQGAMASNPGSGVAKASFERNASEKRTVVASAVASGKKVASVAVMPCPGPVTVSLGSGECGRVIDNFGFGFPDIGVQNISVIPNEDADESLATVYCPSGQTSYRRTFYHGGPTDMRISSLYVGVYEAYNFPLVTFNFYTTGGQRLGTYTTVVPQLYNSTLFVPLPAETNIRIPAGTSYVMEVVANAPYVSVFKIGRNNNGHNGGYSEAQVTAVDCPFGGFVEEEPSGYNANSIVFGLRAVPDDYKYVNTTNAYKEGDFFPSGQYNLQYVVTDADGNSTGCNVVISVNEFEGASGVLACNDQMNVSLDDDCKTVITPALVLEGEQYSCFDDYQVQVYLPNGNPMGNTVNASHAGMTLRYQVTGPNGNRCWGELLVEDKLPPQLVCKDVYATCTSDLSPGSAISPRVPVAAYIQDGSISANETSASTFSVDVAHLMGSTILDVNVYLDITHSRLSDLSAVLTSPDGVTVPLFFDLNCNGQNMMLTLDGQAASTHTDLQNTCDPSDVGIAGSFRPFQSLAVYNGKPLEGSWTVTIYDNEPGQGGQVNEVHLVFMQQGAFVPFPVEGLVTHSYVNNNTYVVNGADNCGPATLSYTDEVVEEDCASVYSRIIKRCWKGTDPKGNIAEPCCHYIYVYRNSLATLQFPPNFDGLPGHEEALSCADYGDTVPGTDVTGQATGDLCATVQILPPVDAKIDICEHSYKILRTHKVVEWCSGQVIVHNQIIKVLDNQGPEIECPDDITVTTNDFDCLATYTASLPKIGNECSDDMTYHLSVNSVDDNDDGFGDETADQTTRVVAGLVLGKNLIRWHVTDECGNSSECRYTVTAEDKILPNAVCDQVTVASVTGNGRAKVDALTFDDGSTDNCGIFSFEARKMTDNCSFGTAAFTPFVEFCCEEVNTTVMVELRVTDVYGNSNTCMVEVNVQDKLPPYITRCPADITVDCKADYTDLDLTGRPDYIDNCGVVEVTHAETASINQCGVGKVSRTWTVKDAQGYTNSCVQRITLFDSDPFYVNTNDYDDPNDDIVWPPNYETAECHAELEPEDLPDGFDRPVVVSDPCSIIAMHHKDQAFTFVDGACTKIIRTWTVIDWCTYNENNPVPGKGLYVYNQIIKLQNKTAPVFTEGCEDRVFETFGACKGLVEYSPEVEDDCTTDAADFIWKYELYNAAGTLLLDKGAQGTFSRELGNGEYIIKWTVEDRCGNRTYCTHKLTVVDGKKPSPYCLSSLATAVMNSDGTIEIWAKDYDKGAYDNCTPASQLIFTFFNALPVDSLRGTIHYFKGNGILATQAEYLSGDAQKWIPASQSSGLLFSCADIPNGISHEVSLEVSVTDLAGNQDYCTVKVLLQDNTNFCPDNTTLLSLSGKAFYGATPVVGAEVVLTSNLPEQNKVTKTGADGGFMFAGLPGSFNYGLSVQDNRGVMNGISTLDLVMIQRHILGLDVFTDPKKVIASDVDNNGRVSSADLIALRKGILGITNTFPNGQQSWRFVRSDYTFTDISQPFPYGEKYDYFRLSVSKKDQNFQAVKIGDVNQSATLSPDDISTEIRSEKAWVVTSPAVKASKGETIRIPVLSAGAMSLMGYQFTLVFDPSKYRFESIETGRYTSDDNFSAHLADKGMITTSWHSRDAVTYEEGEVLFTLVMTALHDTKDQTPYTITSDVTAAVAFDEALEGAPVVMAPRTDEYDVQFSFVSNQPNPFSMRTQLTFGVAETGYVRFTLTDVAGRIIKVLEGEFGKGTHQLELDLQNDAPTGVILCTIQQGSNVVSHKMIRVE